MEDLKMLSGIGVQEVITRNYLCTHCDTSYPDKNQALLCYYSHYGLDVTNPEKAMDIIHKHQKLLDAAKKATWEVQHTCNSETQEKEDMAYKELLDFEREHDLVG